MRVFIVRPFSVKEGIDFDRVDDLLIQPALSRLRSGGMPVTGGTTGDIVQSGNIREDIFRRLLTADLVIADVSIHNANAFYELGVRHALRPGWTFVLRSRTDDAYPFDLQTDRYFLYDAAEPAKSVEDLAFALRSTVDAHDHRDSPIFKLLPNLQPHPRVDLVKVPPSFLQEVREAKRLNDRGKLRLLSAEADDFDWDQEGLREVGEAQYGLRAFQGACETFNKLQKVAPTDARVLQRLGTINQRLAARGGPRAAVLLDRSDEAIKTALEDARRRKSRKDEAEALALLGSNDKTRWLSDIQKASGTGVPAAALRSPHLRSMLNRYVQAAATDLNEHYPAINALAILEVQRYLAAKEPDVWDGLQDDPEMATQQRKELIARLRNALQLSLGLDPLVNPNAGSPDRWLLCSRADFLLITAPQRAERIAQAYRTATSGAERFELEATRRNLDVFRQLGVFEPGLSAALAVVDAAIAEHHPALPPPQRVVLFTGHMVDRPERKQARFPRTPQAEEAARRLIAQAVADECTQGGQVLGMAGAACGGDILFHEVCRDSGVDTEVLLAIPQNRFQVTSVAHAGGQWVERYQQLCMAGPVSTLQEDQPLPPWLTDKRGYDIWQRNSAWMMHRALAADAAHVTLIALYNPDLDPDGPGGTAHLLAQAKRLEFKLVELDARALLR